MFCECRYEIDSTSYNKYLQERVRDTLEESKRYFENYIELRDAYNGLLERQIKKKSKMGTDAEFNALISSLRREQEDLKHDRKALYKNLRKWEDFHKNYEEEKRKNEAKVRTLTEEIDRRNFLETKVQKYVKRIIKRNEALLRVSETVVSTFE